MSILNDSNNIPVVPANIVAANNLKSLTKQTYAQMVRAFNLGSKSFWQNKNATPEQIATALGTDAKEVFELHGKLGQLLANVNPNSIAEGTSIVGTFTINNDGSVTITPTNN